VNDWLLEWQSTTFGCSFWPFWDIVDGFDVIAMNYPVQPHDYVVVLIHCITTDELMNHQNSKLSQKNGVTVSIYDFIGIISIVSRCL
jgi:hypothetical protein